MMELADMRDLGSRAAMRWGSSPHARTSVVASFVSLATAFFRSEQTPSRTHSAAPPFQIEPAALGFNLGFLFLGQSPFGFVSGNSLRLLPKTALTSLPLLPNPKHLASDLFFSFSRTSYRLRRRFFVPNKRHRALTPLLLLSKLNPLRWASIWGFIFAQSPFGFVSGNSLWLLP